MEYYHEIMLYIVENEPLPATELAEHFRWGSSPKRNWIIALRNWGWITPAGHIKSTEKGRNAVLAAER